MKNAFLPEQQPLSSDGYAAVSTKQFMKVAVFGASKHTSLWDYNQKFLRVPKQFLQNGRLQAYERMQPIISEELDFEPTLPPANGTFLCLLSNSNEGISLYLCKPKLQQSAQNEQLIALQSRLNGISIKRG